MQEGKPSCHAATCCSSPFTSIPTLPLTTPPPHHPSPSPPLPLTTPPSPPLPLTTPPPHHPSPHYPSPSPPLPLTTPPPHHPSPSPPLLPIQRHPPHSTLKCTPPHPPTSLLLTHSPNFLQTHYTSHAHHMHLCNFSHLLPVGCVIHARTACAVALLKVNWS